MAEQKLRWLSLMVELVSSVKPLGCPSGSVIERITTAAMIAKADEALIVTILGKIVLYLRVSESSMQTVQSILKGIMC